MLANNVSENYGIFKRIKVIGYDAPGGYNPYTLKLY